MKKIRVLSILFDTEIKAYEIPAFRSAIIEKAGRENILFHNHLDDKSYLYKYPLIQYKQINRKPTIVCIEYGVDEIHKYFENKNWDIKIGERLMEMKIARLNMNQFTLQIWNRLFDYNISNWIALNQENYPKFMMMDNSTDKIAYLENTLKANIISFAKGINWIVDKPIKLKIKELKEPREVKNKGRTMLGFNASFSTNVFLPNYIGLGKSVSKGFGVITSDKTQDPNSKTQIPK